MLPQAEEQQKPRHSTRNREWEAGPSPPFKEPGQPMPQLPDLGPLKLQDNGFPLWHSIRNWEWEAGPSPPLKEPGRPMPRLRGLVASGTARQRISTVLATRSVALCYDSPHQATGLSTTFPSFLWCHLPRREDLALLISPKTTTYAPIWAWTFQTKGL